MSTLLNILASLTPEQMAEGESINLVTGDGRAFSITFGPVVEPACRNCAYGNHADCDARCRCCWVADEGTATDPGVRAGERKGGS